ncbi:MAG: acetyl-CoA carboxylase biotin carboxyl carrier protein [Candidatus Margulisiibacteriota bacterium]|nr:acetyl-CoA carboxylase biotin carboxyl carrier protein [Candidatus Margulisiibacteriota bacterium]
MVNWDLVKKLIKTVKEEEISGLAVEENGVKYEVRRDPVSGGVVPVGIAQSPVQGRAEAKAEAEAQDQEEDGTVAITSPMVGTFYRSPSPESPSFVNNGDDVDAGTVICIIEAMKLFNEIEAEVRGKVVKILVENGQPVEYGQKLMLIKKA